MYRAIHPTIGKHVAIKVMSPTLVNDAESLQRFAREASNAARILHRKRKRQRSLLRRRPALAGRSLALRAGRFLRPRLGESGYLPNRENQEFPAFRPIL